MLTLFIAIFWKLLQASSRDSEKAARVNEHLVKIIAEAISLNTSVLSRLEKNIEVLTSEMHYLRRNNTTEWWKTPHKD